MDENRIIDPNDFIEIQRLCSLRGADMLDKNSAQNLINKYINNGLKWCLTCDPAVRQMFNVLKNWSRDKGIIKDN